MKRPDIAGLRKSAGMSQRELADKLGVRQSFLSAIENGRSRMPEEKLDKVKKIFGIDDFGAFVIDDAETAAVVVPHTHEIDEKDAITRLLEHIHDLAHQKDRSAHRPDSEDRARMDMLEKRNDRLSQRVDELRDEVDRLRDENYRLKELLCRSGIDY